MKLLVFDGTAPDVCLLSYAKKEDIICTTIDLENIFSGVFDLNFLSFSMTLRNEKNRLFLSNNRYKSLLLFSFLQYRCIDNVTEVWCSIHQNSNQTEHEELSKIVQLCSVLSDLKIAEPIRKQPSTCFLHLPFRNKTFEELKSSVPKHLEPYIVETTEHNRKDFLGDSSEVLRKDFGNHFKIVV